MTPPTKQAGVELSRITEVSKTEQSKAGSPLHSAPSESRASAANWLQNQVPESPEGSESSRISISAGPRPSVSDVV